MKKSLILSILFAFVLALVGCNKAPENGCKCKTEVDGESVGKAVKYTVKQMKKLDVTTCADLEDALMEAYEEAMEEYGDDDDYGYDDYDDYYAPRKAAKKSKDPDIEISCEGY